MTHAHVRSSMEIPRDGLEVGMLETLAGGGEKAKALLEQLSKTRAVLAEKTSNIQYPAEVLDGAEGEKVHSYKTRTGDKITVFTDRGSASLNQSRTAVSSKDGMVSIVGGAGQKGYGAQVAQTFSEEMIRNPDGMFNNRDENIKKREDTMENEGVDVFYLGVKIEKEGEGKYLKVAGLGDELDLFVFDKYGNDKKIIRLPEQNILLGRDDRVVIAPRAMNLDPRQPSWRNKSAKALTRMIEQNSDSKTERDFAIIDIK